MRRLLLLLTIAFVFLSIDSRADEQEPKIDSNINQRREMVVELIKSLDSIVEAEWINAVTLEVTIDPKYSYTLSEDEAMEQADLIAKLGKEITHEKTCVTISVPAKKNLAYKCIRKYEDYFAEDVVISDRQLEIAQIIKSHVRGIKKAKWITSSTLEITTYGDADQKEFNKKYSLLIASQVHEALGKRICINLINTENEKLAYECFGENEHI